MAQDMTQLLQETLRELDYLRNNWGSLSRFVLDKEGQKVSNEFRDRLTVAIKN
ncbi:TPA: hypothetical protein HA265_05465, partial [Candidatus Woesearchaeota archaeon]|nr:hypothetical protein [Candidatus Woesearchaeota archaeon]